MRTLFPPFTKRAAFDDVLMLRSFFSVPLHIFTVNKNRSGISFRSYQLITLGDICTTVLKLEVFTVPNVSNWLVSNCCVWLRCCVTPLVVLSLDLNGHHWRKTIRLRFLVPQRKILPGDTLKEMPGRKCFV